MRGQSLSRINCGSMFIFVETEKCREKEKLAHETIYLPELNCG